MIESLTSSFLSLGMDEKKDYLHVVKDDFNPLQVGMTNQSPASVKRFPHSPILTANSNSTMNTPSPILKPNRSMLTTRIRKQGLSKVSIPFSVN